MKAMKRKMNVRVVVLAVQGALAAVAAMPVQAQEEAGASLKIPPNTVEIEVLNVSQDSSKFGEYTGLKESGAYVNGGFGIRGGDGYGNENGTRRWELWGTDLGLTSRSAGGSVGDQGRWNLGVTFDQLTHYTSDSYQTPYSGNMGGNNFTLPNFGLGSEYPRAVGGAAGPVPDDENQQRPAEHFPDRRPVHRPAMEHQGRFQPPGAVRRED